MVRVNFTSIPFKIEAHHGLSQADGLAKFSSAGIVLEFETKILGLVKTGVKEVRLPMEEIMDVRFKKGIFRYGAKIEIRMSTMLKLSEVPNADGKIILKILREDHARAAGAVATLERDLRGFEEALPPPQTPVRSLFEPEVAETDQLKTNELETDKLPDER